MIFNFIVLASNLSSFDLHRERLTFPLFFQVLHFLFLVPESLLFLFTLSLLPLQVQLLVGLLGTVHES